MPNLRRGRAAIGPFVRETSLVFGLLEACVGIVLTFTTLVLPTEPFMAILFTSTHAVSYNASLAYFVLMAAHGIGCVFGSMVTELFIVFDVTASIVSQMGVLTLVGVRDAYAFAFMLIMRSAVATMAFVFFNERHASRMDRAKNILYVYAILFETALFVPWCIKAITWAASVDSLGCTLLIVASLLPMVNVFARCGRRCLSSPNVLSGLSTANLLFVASVFAYGSWIGARAPLPWSITL